MNNFFKIFKQIINNPYAFPIAILLYVPPFITANYLPNLDFVTNFYNTFWPFFILYTLFIIYLFLLKKTITHKIVCLIGGLFLIIAYSHPRELSFWIYNNNQNWFYPITSFLLCFGVLGIFPTLGKEAGGLDFGKMEESNLIV
jgi:hypothetical protein